MLVAGIVMLLLSCWTFWAWTVGESRNYKWMRQWCAGMFVIQIAVLSAGTSALITGRLTKTSARRTMSEAVIALRERLVAGETARVIRELQSLDHRDDPDADAYDVLEELPQMAQRLRNGQDATKMATADSRVSR